MYEAMNEFFTCKSLTEEQEQEIVGFYAKTLKNIATHGRPHQQHAAHVVHHYADGARSLGLTEREIKHEMEKIKDRQKHETDDKKKNSPYAKPMKMIPKINKSVDYRKKYSIMEKANIVEGHAIWRGTPIVNYHVPLPCIGKHVVKNVDRTFTNLKAIRKDAHKQKNDYRIGLNRVQTTNNTNLWDMLRYKQIPCESLKNVLKEVYGAYTTHVKMQPLNDKAKYVAYSIHDFSTLFAKDDSDDEAGDDEQRVFSVQSRK